MSEKIRLAVDAMSGDLGPRVAIAAALRAAISFPDLELFLVGDEHHLHSLFPRTDHTLKSRFTFVHAPDVIGMDEDPLVSLRHKKNSSMWRALELVRTDTADACISAGNTGALIAIAKYLLKTLPGIDRPAICKSLPVIQGHSYMLDLGANLICSAEQLHQFALMGSVLAAFEVAEKPRVALLNVGIENNKGTDVIKAAHDVLQTDARLNYVGFIEANTLFHGNTDVIVCDGFSGNIALKASEGVASLIAQKIQKACSRTWYLKLTSLFLSPALRSLNTELTPGTYNGACILGLKKPVIKSHGGADEQAFFYAFQEARNQVLQKIPERISTVLAANLNNVIASG